MLKKYGMEGVKPAATPISTTIKLTKDEKGKEVDEKLVSVSPNPNTLYPDFIFDIYNMSHCFIIYYSCACMI